MIKSKEELKDVLIDIFDDALTDKSNPPYYTDKVDPENDGCWQYKVYELCADAIIEAGYGDVSEYKAEIERLTHIIEYCENEELVKSKVKQAQIDVLNKLKDIFFDYLGVKNIKEAEALSLLDSTLTYDVVTCGIDELIKEVQNVEDNG